MDTFQEHGYSSERMGPVQEHNALTNYWYTSRTWLQLRNMVTVQEYDYSSGT
jgi:hypothetical protein